ncbi:MAG: Hsp20/alpha crystallin family protein [Candidatus Gracilibacteria bacterium]|nr:Hsp20/alpha crystallin family protein [Candidatus Gracilibacteria bacterium]
MAQKPSTPIGHYDEQEGQLALDIYQTDSEIIILSAVAGVTEDELNISVTDEVLTIKGKRKLDDKVPEEDYLTKECFWGDFSRSIVLPASADSAKIAASFKNGILRIAIPKVEKLQTKVIRIKT